MLGCTLAMSAAIPQCGSSFAMASLQDSQGFEAEFPSMGSKINLRWFGDKADQEQVLSAARKMADRWVRVLSDYDPKSEAMVASSNAATGHFSPLSDSLWSVVEMCDQWHRWSNGAFDAALGALTVLRRQRKQATPAQWDEARSRSGWSLVELDAPNHAIRFTIPGVRLDFGAIGKGIVVDRIADKFEEMGIVRFVVNASGNMRIGQSPPDTLGWPIAIDVPISEATDNSLELLRMRISRCGIATSGDRWQRFPDGTGSKRNDATSHIIDPKTKLGVTGSQSVTILAESAADADAAATATCVRAHNDLSGWFQTLSERKPKLQALVLLKDEASEATRMISNLNDSP
jgi:FAD:protein FMN transferase